jgi:hypothetical protein
MKRFATPRQTRKSGWSSDKEALDRLESALKHSVSQPATNGRSATTSALRAALDFLNEGPQWTMAQIRLPLFDLLAELSDLDIGRVGPLLSPTNLANHNLDPALLQMMQGHAIFAIERLVAMGEKASSASREVAKIWNDATGERRERERNPQELVLQRA